MKTEDLIIGEEYYFDNRKESKGIYKGKRKEINGLTSVFFEPTSDHDYLEERGSLGKFSGCVGFLDGENMIPVKI